MREEPANPPGLVKPTAEENDALADGRVPDLMHLLAKVAKTERSLTRPANGEPPSIGDQRSAAALRRLADHAVRTCAESLQEALVMHPARASKETT